MKSNLKTIRSSTTMKLYQCVICLIALGLLIITVPVARAAASPYHLLKEIPVGGEGGWDYLSVDSAGRRLYVSHATKVVVIDLDKQE